MVKPRSGAQVGLGRGRGRAWFGCAGPHRTATARPRSRRTRAAPTARTSRTVAVAHCRRPARSRRRRPPGQCPRARTRRRRQGAERGAATDIERLEHRRARTPGAAEVPSARAPCSPAPSCGGRSGSPRPRRTGWVPWSTTSTSSTTPASSPARRRAARSRVDCSSGTVGGRDADGDGAVRRLGEPGREVTGEPFGRAPARRSATRHQVEPVPPPITEVLNGNG